MAWLLLLAFEENYTPPVWPDSPLGSALLWRVALLFGLLLVMLLALMWWFRPLPSASRETPGNGLQVVASLGLGAGCSLHLLEFEDSNFVVGVDASGLKMIHPLNEPFSQLVDAPIPPIVPTPDHDQRADGLEDSAR